MTKQTMSEDISQLALALSKFHGTSGPIAKTKTANAGTYKYKYADLSDIFGTISETLMRCELCVTQFFSEEENRCYLTTLLAHSSGQWIKSVLSMSDHEQIQKLGSEITYLRRYALSSILGIAPDDDEDGAIANQADRKPLEKKAPTPQKKLNQDQVNQLIDLSVQIEDMDFMKKFVSYYEVNSIKEIDPVKFNHAVNWLMTKINSKGVPKREYATA